MSNTLNLTESEASAAHAAEPVVEPAADALIGSDVGGYVVEALLGEGGMGLVYRARHPILNRHFAIKVLRPEAAADARISVNFEREAQTLSSLKHPHIIDIVGFGVLTDGRQYMVMEFIKGQTLLEELEQSGQIDLHRALKLADQILDGLDAAHSVGVIHRDMKPGNVLIAKVSGGTEVLKLLDFGLAKQQPESLIGRLVEVAAGASVIAGTPEYIAPEQAQGMHAGKHSDIYSFGVVLFEMLTGVPPFNPAADDPDRIRTLLKMHLHRPAPLISANAPAGYFPVELEELVADLLDKSPVKRPSSAATVRARLQKIQRGLHVESTHMVPNPLGAGSVKRHSPTARVIPLSKTEKEIKPERPKSKAPLWAGAVAAVLLLGGGWWWRAQGVEAAAKPVVAVAIAPAGVESNPEPEPAAALPDEALDDDVMALVSDGPDDLSSLKSRKVHHSQIASAGCAPDPEWKKRSRADLNELVTRASKLSQDISLWAAYREAPLSAAIEAATSRNECAAVNRQLMAFKVKVTGK